MTPPVRAARARARTSVLAASLAWLTIATVSVVPNRARAEGDAPASESALRRRVQRFYVFSYLNRHGEMWEMFTPELQARLGGDRKEYVRQARSQGYELYSSQIESLSIDGNVGVVSVRLQVQVAGAATVTWRRHRMVWHREGAQWAYAGSMDVSAEDPAAGAQLQAVPGTSLGPFSGEELLPRPEAGTPPAAAATRPPPAPAAATSAPPEATTAERWDLVAIPPPGTGGGPMPAPAGGEVPAAPAGGEVPAAPAGGEVPAAPASRIADDSAEAPSIAHAPAPARAPAIPNGSPPPGEDSLSGLVRKATHGSAMRRLRALAAIRNVRDRSLALLLAQSMGQAPPESVAVFLDKLAEFGAVEHLRLVRAQLASEAPLVRAAALRAVGDLGGPADQRAVEALLADSYRDVRVDALGALGRLGGAPGPALARVLADTSRAADELAAAATAAGTARAADCEDGILALMARRVPAVATLAAIEACGRLGTPACVAALRGLLADRGGIESRGEPVPVRLLAARALAIAGADGGGLEFAHALVASHETSSTGDADIVAATGELRALLVLLGHGRPMLRRRAAELIGRAVDGPQDRELALAALTSARNLEADAAALLAEQGAIERLRGMDQVGAAPGILR